MPELVYKPMRLTPSYFLMFLNRMVAVYFYRFRHRTVMDKPIKPLLTPN